MTKRSLRSWLSMSSMVADAPTVTALPSTSEVAQRRKREFFSLLDEYMRDHTVGQAELVRAAEDLWRADEYERQEAGLRKTRRALRRRRHRSTYSHEAHEVAMEAAGGRNWSRGRPTQLSRVFHGGLPGLGKHHH